MNSATFHFTEAPSDWVTRWSPLVAASARFLDLAAGRGRHANWLAAQGYRVTALDRDRSALDNLAESVERIEADLEDGSPWPLGKRTFDGVIVTNYLHRPLFPRVHDALSTGGLLIYETFALGNERFGRPSNPDFLLRPGELLEFCSHFGLVAMAYESRVVDTPKTAAIQRLVARRPS